MTDWIQIISNLATAGAFFAVVVQVRQTQEEHRAKLRPWIASVNEKPSLNYPHVTESWWNYIIVTIKNYGEIPFTKGTVKSIITTNKIEIEDLRAIKGDRVGIIVPQNESSWLIYNDNKVPIPKTEVDPFFVGFLIEYVFLNTKPGEYGFIAKYELSTKGFSFIDDWAK